MLQAWSGFYQMTGEASATLAGLLFLVVSLTAGRSVQTSENGVRLFTSPTMFLFAFVLVLSALALMPAGDGRVPLAAMSGWTAVALAHAIWVMGRMRGLTQNLPHWSDFWCYGVAPAGVFGVLAAGLGLVWAGNAAGWFVAGFGVAGVLAVGVRNGWDLITWLAPRSGGTSGGGG
jgi:hypothetical protein